MIMELVHKQLQKKTIQSELTLNKNEMLNLKISSDDVVLINDYIKEKHMSSYTNSIPTDLWR